MAKQTKSAVQVETTPEQVQEEVLETANVVEVDSSTPQQKLIELIGKRVTIEDGKHRPYVVILQYVGENDIISKEGSHYPFHQVIGEAE